MPYLSIDNSEYEIDGILFDKDGTLLDFVGFWGRWSEVALNSFNEGLKERGLKLIPSDEIPVLWGTRHDSEGHVNGYDRKGALAMGTISELLAIMAWQGYRRGLSWGEAMVLARGCKEAADESLEREHPARPLPGVMDFLQQCRDCGLPMGIVTADETKAAELHLEWMGIRHLFDVVIGADRVERSKPFPDMLLLACLEMRLEPSRSAIIGDTNGDMAMGKAAGVAVAVGVVIGAEQDEVELTDADICVAEYSQMRLAGQRNEG